MVYEKRIELDSFESKLELVTNLVVQYIQQ